MTVSDKLAMYAGRKLARSLVTGKAPEEDTTPRPPLADNRPKIDLPDYGFMGAVKDGMTPTVSTPAVSTPTPTPTPTVSTPTVSTPTVSTPTPTQTRGTPTATTTTKTTPTGIDFNKGAGREDEITANITKGITDTPNAFRSRNTFNQAYGYESAAPAKKAILDREFEKFNAQDTIARRQKLSDKITAKRNTKNNTVTTTEDNILSLTPEQVDQKKQEQLKTFKVEDEATAQRDVDNALGALKTTNDNLRNLYGINADGSIDENRPNSLAATAKKSLEDYRKVQNENADKFESARKSQVVGQMYQRLAQQGKDISKLPPEVVIALSDEVASVAFKDIYNAKTDTLNRIQTKEDNTLNAINKLREEGTISENDYVKSTAQVKSAFDKTKQTINKNFANDLFGLADKATARKEQKSTTNLNFLNALVDKVGIPVANANKYVSDIMKKLPNASPAEIQKLLLSNPAFLKEAEDVQKAKKAAAQQKAEIELAITQAKIDKDRSQTVKNLRPPAARSSSGGGTKATPFSAIDQSLLRDQTGIGGLKTVDDVEALSRSNPEAYAKANAYLNLKKKQEDTGLTNATPAPATPTK